MRQKVESSHASNSLFLYASALQRMALNIFDIYLCNWSLTKARGVPVVVVVVESRNNNNNNNKSSSQLLPLLCDLLQAKEVVIA
jgi:hypothetical protein